MILVFLGVPGSGKGTQARLLSKNYPFVHLSTGDLVRHEIDSKTEFGQNIRAVVEDGEYISDQIILALVEKKLDSCSNYILDGFPRTLQQAQALNELVNKLGQKIIAVINFEINAETVLKRLSGRFLCTNCGAIYNKYFTPLKNEGICDSCQSHNFTSRADDSENSVMKRLKIFNETNSHVIKYYQHYNNVVNINSDQPLDVIFKEISLQLKSL